MTDQNDYREMISELLAHRADAKRYQRIFTAGSKERANELRDQGYELYIIPADELEEHQASMARLGNEYLYQETHLVQGIIGGRVYKSQSLSFVICRLSAENHAEDMNKRSLMFWENNGD